jgi:hypothetical protein
MRPYKIRGTVITIDFSKLDDEDVEQWAKSIGVEYIDEIPDLTATVDVTLTDGDLSDDLIKSEYITRFRQDEDAVAHAYTLLAAGDVSEAMDLLSREFQLAPPAHEKKIADLLSRGRGCTHAQN